MDNSKQRFQNFLSDIIVREAQKRDEKDKKRTEKHKKPKLSTF